MTLEITQASSSPARTRASWASSAPPVSPCLPTSRSSRVASKSRSGSQPCARSACTGRICACGESASPKPTRRPRRSSSERDARVRARDDQAAPAAVGVAHRQRPRRRRCARSVSTWARFVFHAVSSAPGEQILDLVLVAVVVPRREREALLGEPGAEVAPDLLDLRVVDDRAEPVAVAHQNSSCPQRALPRKSCSRSVVGRHHRRGARVTEMALERAVLGVRRAAADAQAQIRHLDRHLGGRRLERQHAEHARPASRARPARRPRTGTRAPARAGSWPRPAAPARRGRPPALRAEMLEPRAGRVRGRRLQRRAGDADRARRRAERRTTAASPASSARSRRRSRRAAGRRSRAGRGPAAAPTRSRASRARRTVPRSRSRARRPGPGTGRSSSGSSEPGAPHASTYESASPADVAKLLSASIDRAAVYGPRPRHLRPEVPARPALGVGERGQVLTARGRRQRRVLRPVRLVIGDARGQRLHRHHVHHEHHPGRRARSRDALDRLADRHRPRAPAAEALWHREPERPGHRQRGK